MFLSVRYFFVLMVMVFVLGCGSDEGTETENGGEETASGEEANTEGEGSSEETAGGEQGEEAGDEQGDEVGQEGAVEEEGGDESGEGSEVGEESGGEGVEPPGGLLPEGAWLLRLDEGLCVDFSGLAAPLSMAGYAVLMVDGTGTAEITFYDASWEEFKSLTLDKPDFSEEGLYRVTMDPLEIPEPGANCTQTLSFEMVLEESAGGMVGTMVYSEGKKGGGCSTDGCEGTMNLKVTPLGEPVDPGFASQGFPYAYVNTSEGVEEEGDILLYPVEGQPYFLLFDIPSPDTALDLIRGKKYIAGSNHLWGRAVQFVYDEGCTNIEQWDLSLTLATGSGFSGTLEHLSLYHVDCEDSSEELSVGEMTAPAP